MAAKKKKKTTPKPAAKKEVTKREAVFAPNAKQREQIAAVWFRPEKYTNAFCMAGASKVMKKDISRNHLNREFGPRSNPKGETLPKDHGGLIKAMTG